MQGDGLKRRWVNQDGVLVKQVEQPDPSVKAVLDFTHYCRTTGEKGGLGSKDMRFLANVPLVQAAQWTHDWRMKGGLQGTGLKCQEYVILQASMPDYGAFVSTPSGRTGFERQARRLQFGYRNYGRGVKLQPLTKAPPKPIIRSAE